VQCLDREVRQRDPQHRRWSTDWLKTSSCESPLKVKDTLGCIEYQVEPPVPKHDTDEAAPRHLSHKPWHAESMQDASRDSVATRCTPWVRRLAWR